jgi:hypothetical protein
LEHADKFDWLWGAQEFFSTVQSDAYRIQRDEWMKEYRRARHALDALVPGPEDRVGGFYETIRFKKLEMRAEYDRKLARLFGEMALTVTSLRPKSED